MKMLLVAMLCLGSFNSFADHHEEMEGKTLAEKKTMMVERLDARISRLNDSKTCVSAAADEAGLQTCKDKMKAEAKEMKKKWKEMKKKKNK